MSMAKLMTPSRIVKERTRVALAAFIVPLTASVICLFVAMAMYLGKLAATVAAFSAAWQLASRFSFASATDPSADADEIESRNATNKSEMIGYASHVRERMYGRVRYGLSVDSRVA